MKMSLPLTGSTAFALLLLFMVPDLKADFWPEFRGVTGAGHASDAKVPLHWSISKNIRWRIPVEGKAWSTPVVADGSIFVTTAVTQGDALSLQARCYKLSDGKPIWEREIFAKEADVIHQKNSHASPTPVYAEGRLYLHFGHYGTACLNAADGTILWTQTSLPHTPVHGNGSSPVFFEDKLIFACDGGKEPYVVALSKIDGTVVWKTPRDVAVQNTFSFSTPLLIDVNGLKQAIIPGSGAVVSYNPSNGEEIWRFRYGEGYSVVPRPLYHLGKIYVCSGFNRAILYAVKADGKGDVTDTHLVWQDDKAIPKESSPIIVDNLLYVNDDKGILSCFDAETGTEHFRERLDGQGGYSASPVYAGGHLFFHNGEGITTVIKPGETFTKIAENKIEEAGLSSFAVVSDGFIVRTEGHLIRIGQ